MLDIVLTKQVYSKSILYRVLNTFCFNCSFGLLVTSPPPPPITLDK
jgi:hypothetical protein